MISIYGTLNNFLPKLITNMLIDEGDLQLKLKLEKKQKELDEKYSLYYGLPDRIMRRDTEFSEGNKENLRVMVLHNRFKNNYIKSIEIPKKLILLDGDIKKQKIKLDKFFEESKVDILKIYKEEINIIQKTCIQELIDSDDSEKEIEEAKRWYEELILTLNNFHSDSYVLLSSFTKEVDSLKDVFESNNNFDEKSFGSLMQQISTIKDRYCLDKLMEKWKADYAAALSNTMQGRIASYQAAASRFQSVDGE